MLKVKIADTPSKLEQGLMFVENLPSDEGMLFIFPRPMKLSFWGRNTLIPLDIAFINSRNEITKIAQIRPMDLHAVQSEEECISAIEANIDYFKDQKVTIGSKIEVERFRDSYQLGVVRFNNIEGSLTKSEKIKTDKQAQIADPTLQPEVEPKIEKPGQKSVGDPIGPLTPEQENPQNLPVITPGDLGKYLEDSHDDESPQNGVENFESSLNDFPEEEQEPEAPVEEAPQEAVEPAEDEYPQFTTAYAALDWATHNNEVVRITYTSKKGRQITRDIEPHGQFHSESTHRQILVVFDETVGDIRAFIIHNITKWAFVGKQFTKKFVVRA